MSISSDFLLLL